MPEWFGDVISETLRNTEGSVVIARPRPQVVCTTAVGHFTVKYAEAVLRVTDLALQSGKPVAIFHHWWDLTTYDAESRPMLTDHTRAHLRWTESVHILFRSQLVVIAVRAANLALGGRIKSYGDPAAFTAAWDRWFAATR